MHAVALAAGKIPHQFLLVGPAEIEAAAIRARLNFGLADKHDVVAAGDFLPHGFSAIERVTALVDVGELYGFANAQFPAVWFFLAGDHAEQRCLAGAVRTDHADDAAARKIEADAVDEQPVAVTLGQVFRLHHHVAETRARRDEDLLGFVA